MSKHHWTESVGRIAQRRPPHIGVVLGYILGVLVILGLMWVIAAEVL